MRKPLWWPFEGEEFRSNWITVRREFSSTRERWIGLLPRSLGSVRIQTVGGIFRNGGWIESQRSFRRIYTSRSWMPSIDVFLAIELRFTKRVAEKRKG